MEWRTIESAPKGVDVLVSDGVSVCQAIYDDDPTLADFMMICDDGEGETEFQEWFEENRGQGWITHCCLTGDLEFLDPTMWQPLPEPPKGENI